MDFELDDGQLALQEAAAQALAKACPPALLREVAEGRADGAVGATDADAELWSAIVRLEWPGLAIDEDAGGSGATAVELGLVIEQLGYVADPTPFLATTSQYVPVVQASTDAAQRRRLLSAVAGGGTGTLALAGADGRWDPASPPVRAERTTAGWRLAGRAAFVVDGDRADEIAVLADSTDGPLLAVVPGDAVDARRDPAFDLTLHVTTVAFDGVEVGDDRVLAVPDAAATVAAALEVACTGLALTSVGACQRGFDLALDYSKQRQQFGVPIGSFQALKHKAVDMLVAVERARALGYFAALCIAEHDPRRPVAAAMAKVAAGDAQRVVFRHAVQVFGGIGFTWENDLHLYLRRAAAADLLVGSAAHHRAAVGRAVLARTAATGS